MKQKLTWIHWRCDKLELLFHVNQQSIYRTDLQKVVSDSKNYLTAKFSFSEDWTGTKTAIFTHDDTSYTVILDENDSCHVPWEVIKPYSFQVSVFCGDLHTANISVVEVEQSGYTEGETPSPPSPTVYDQLIEKADHAEQVAQSVRNDADEGKFNGENGEQGPQGPPGKDGITPQRGTDYWTEEDQIKIISDTMLEIEESGKYAEKADTLSGYGINDAYTKTEIDGKIGEIETALDEIIALENSYIGGDAE